MIQSFVLNLLFSFHSNNNQWIMRRGTFSVRKYKKGSLLSIINWLRRLNFDDITTYYDSLEETYSEIYEM